MLANVGYNLSNRGNCAYRGRNAGGGAASPFKHRDLAKPRTGFEGGDFAVATNDRHVPIQDDEKFLANVTLLKPRENERNREKPRETRGWEILLVNTG